MSLLAAARGVLKRSQFIIGGVHWSRRVFRSTLYGMSPVLLAQYRFRTETGRWLNLESPRTFDEKLLWLMLYWRHPLKTQCGDKYGVRAFVTQRGLAHILPELLGVYGHSSEIDFDALPERFVLKCTHGCRFNIVCHDKRHLDVVEARRKLDSWMRVDFSRVYGEIHYAAMQPRIICERFLDDLGSSLPCDYKLYCFDGRVCCAMACTSRGEDGHGAKYYWYDREWQRRLPYDKTTLQDEQGVSVPESYGEMLAAAEKLSKPFPFVRVDFYNISGKAVLGEMTFTPGGCIDLDLTALAQRELGDLIVLPKKMLG